MSFQKKNVVPLDRVCIRLKALRENAGVSLCDIAEKTKINRPYLQAIEECNFSELHVSPMYLKNFVKKYVLAVGGDPRPYLDQLNDEELGEKEKLRVAGPTRKKHSFQFSDIPGAIRFGVMGLVVIGLLSYLGLHVNNILKPPHLSVANPMDGFISKENSIVISGSSEPETKIMVNNVVIKNDETGNFSETITLTPGINTLVIQAENKHGRTSKDIRHVIFKQTASISRK